MILWMKIIILDSTAPSLEKQLWGLVQKGEAILLFFFYMVGQKT